MENIVNRLRDSYNAGSLSMCREAADEIERLRNELIFVKGERDTARQVLGDLHNSVNAAGGAMDKVYLALDDLYRDIRNRCKDGFKK
jgi:hypothetical protein